MFKYFVKKALVSVLTLWIVATATFALMHMVPGGPFLAEKTPSAATLAALKEKYGLDQPIHIQYKNYFVKLFRGDMGPSLKQRGREVNDIISTGFKVSARVGGLAVLLAICVGVPLGSLAAFNRGKWLDSVILIFSTTGIAVPSFVTATVLMMIFSVKFNLLPTYGLTSWKHYIMPVMSLAFYPSSYISRLTRSSMLEVMGQDYIRTARAKGLPKSRVIFKHALRNALLRLLPISAPFLPIPLQAVLW